MTQDQVIQAPAPSSSRDPEGMRSHVLAGALAVLLLVGGVGGWALTAELAGAIIANGMVVVESNVKKVQHPTGGIVGEIRVREGDEVRAGDVLVRLDETLTRANLQIVSGQLDELEIRSARLTAELEGAATLKLPRELTARAHEEKLQEIFEGERILLESRREALLGKKAQLKERVTQLGQEITGLAAQQAAKEREIELIKRELIGLFELQKKDLVPSIKVMSLEREAARLEGERGQLIAAAAQAKGKITEIELQAVQLDQDQKAEVIKELREIQAKQAELAERRVAAEDQLRRIEIKSPQDGIVHQLAVHTIGGMADRAEHGRNNHALAAHIGQRGQRDDIISRLGGLDI